MWLNLVLRKHVWCMIVEVRDLFYYSFLHFTCNLVLVLFVFSHFFNSFPIARYEAFLHRYTYALHIIYSTRWLKLRKITKKCENLKNVRKNVNKWWRLSPLHSFSPTPPLDVIVWRKFKVHNIGKVVHYIIMLKSYRNIIKQRSLIFVTICLSF